MNTSPVQSLDEQEEEITTTTKAQKAAITQAEIQEETLQLESLGTKNTSMKLILHQVKILHLHKPKTGKKLRYHAKDTSAMQVQVGNTDLQVNDEQQDPDIPEDQTSRASQDDNY